MSLENGAEWFDKWTIVKIIAEVHNSSAVLGDLVGCGIGFRIPPYRSLTKFVRFKIKFFYRSSKIFDVRLERFVRHFLKQILRYRSLAICTVL